jgi:hypothetical protein
MNRDVQPELLDELPHDDPAAIASRRDIARLNRTMGNECAMRDLLLRATGTRTPRRIIELGAGDGKFMLGLARKLSAHWRCVQVVLVDRKDAVPPGLQQEFKAFGWDVEVVVADVFDWLKKPEARADAMVANLFLHHFKEKELARLLALAAERTSVFAATEPRRSTLALASSRMVGFIGCNAVTRHDAVASVRAGFAGNELSSLWPAKAEWRLEEQRAGMFTHAFLATRNSED